MNSDLAKIVDGKKFMWDGETYDSREQAVRAADSYKVENFETEIEEAEGKFLVYSRRVVKEVVATTQ